MSLTTLIHISTFALSFNSGLKLALLEKKSCITDLVWWTAATWLLSSSVACLIDFIDARLTTVVLTIYRLLAYSNRGLLLRLSLFRATGVNPTRKIYFSRLLVFIMYDATALLLFISISTVCFLSLQNSRKIFILLSDLFYDVSIIIVETIFIIRHLISHKYYVRSAKLRHTYMIFLYLSRVTLCFVQVALNARFHFQISCLYIAFANNISDAFAVILLSEFGITPTETLHSSICDMSPADVVRLYREVADMSLALKRDQGSRSAIIQFLCHELRNPLNVILNTASVSIYGKNDREQIDIPLTDMNDIVIAASYSSNLITDVFEFEALDYTPATLELDRVLLADTFSKIKSAAASSTFGKSSIKWTIEPRILEITAMCDERRFSQIFVYIVHTMDGPSEIKVCLIKRWQSYTTDLILSTTDPYGFAFPSIASRQNKRYTWIALEMEAMSVALEDNSENEYQGKSDLSLKVMEKSVRQLGGMVSYGIHSTKVILPLRLIETPPPPSTIAGTSVAAQSKAILVVDDSALNRKLLIQTIRHIISDPSLVIDQAGDGDEAVRAIKSHVGKYGLVFMDIIMPIMSGLEACRIIVQDVHDLPIVFVTANNLIDSPERLKINEVGGKEVLSKPINRNLIQKILEKYLH